MHLSTSSSDRDGVASIVSERKPVRAGLRVPPAGGQPNGVFVVVEMVVLVIVAALAMVAIIVSSGGSDDDGRAASAIAQSRAQATGKEGAGMHAGPSAGVGEPGNASVTTR